MDCKQEVSLLENPVIFRNFCFFLTILELFPTSYAMYLLIYHSPTQMKDMKRCLINLAFWTRAMDLMYSFLLIPYFFIPTLVVLPVGLFSLIGLKTEIQLVVLVIIIAGLGSAVVMIFENRFNAMCPPYFRFKMNKRREYHCIMFVISFSLLISSFLRLEDQNSAKNSYVNYFLCPIPEFFTTAFSFKPVSNTMLITTVLLFSLVILIQVIFFTGFSFYFLFSIERSKMSSATRKLQLKFFYTTWLQMLTHLAVIILPMGYTFFSFLLLYRNQVLVNISTIIISLHGSITSISTIAINRPFRNRFKMWLFPKRFKKRRSSTNLNVLAVSSSWL
ncbi:Serpentine Receptor, class H [Caenorhabditis elegans]|uniref:Serpentine Receptor, class H n=1 Tax=Caenorhabditis elegans TaxID=6239 RepID=Q17690_CAEEL|nr:Serpentine Receptor, class H [Caenorhabditis elegans]CCD61465.1 Serpentine Receptor, class H [Caenorhabditis elegans]|eukprot:NP_495632.1 Serpentine Receptor, class H [Caenorhabditis elegans]